MEHTANPLLSPWTRPLSFCWTAGRPTIGAAVRWSRRCQEPGSSAIGIARQKEVSSHGPTPAQHPRCRSGCAGAAEHQSLPRAHRARHLRPHTTAMARTASRCSRAAQRPARLAVRSSNTNSNAVRTANLSRELKSRVKNRLIAELDPTMDLSKTAEVRAAHQDPVRPDRRGREHRAHPRRARAPVRGGRRPTSSASGRSSRCCRIRPSAKSWSTARTRSTSSRRASCVLADVTVRRRRARAAHHRPHRLAARPPHRRVVARSATRACPTAPA